MLAPVGLTSKESLSHGIARYEHGTACMPYHQRHHQFPFRSLDLARVCDIVCARALAVP